METAAAATPASVFDPSVNIYFFQTEDIQLSCKENYLYVAGLFVSSLNLVKSKRTV